MSTDNPTTPEPKDIPPYLLITLDFFQDHKIMALGESHGPIGILFYQKTLIALANNKGFIPRDLFHLYNGNHKNIYERLISLGLLKIDNSDRVYSGRLLVNIDKLVKGRIRHRKKQQRYRDNQKAIRYEERKMIEYDRKDAEIAAIQAIKFDKEPNI